MATKKDLEREVDRLNDIYCRNTKNHLVINHAYGGYSVELTGKKYRKGALSGAVIIGNQYHDTATNTLNGLYKADSHGWIKNSINYYEKRK